MKYLQIGEKRLSFPTAIDTSNDNDLNQCVGQKINFHPYEKYEIDEYGRALVHGKLYNAEDIVSLFNDKSKCQIVNDFNWSEFMKEQKNCTYNSKEQYFAVEHPQHSDIRYTQITHLEPVILQQIRIDIKVNGQTEIMSIYVKMPTDEIQAEKVLKFGGYAMVTARDFAMNKNEILDY